MACLFLESINAQIASYSLGTDLSLHLFLLQQLDAVWYHSIFSEASVKSMHNTSLPAKNNKVSDVMLTARGVLFYDIGWAYAKWCCYSPNMTIKDAGFGCHLTLDLPHTLLLWCIFFATYCFSNLFPIFSFHIFILLLFLNVAKDTASDLLIYIGRVWNFPKSEVSLKWKLRPQGPTVFDQMLYLYIWSVEKASCIAFVLVYSRFLG